MEMIDMVITKKLFSGSNSRSANICCSVAGFGSFADLSLSQDIGRNNFDRFDWQKCKICREGRALKTGGSEGGKNKSFQQSRVCKLILWFNNI